LALDAEERFITSRSISRIERDGAVKLLRLADFTRPLFPLGGDAGILADPNYENPNLWALAIHRHPQNLDGIYFQSRYSHGPSIAVFDRVRMVPVGDPIALELFPELPMFLDEYQIGLVP
jgi:hypothetical protein